MSRFQEDPFNFMFNWSGRFWGVANFSKILSDVKGPLSTPFLEPSDISQSQAIHWIICFHSQIPLLPILACICQGSPSNNITSHLYCKHAFQDNLPTSSLLTSKIYCCVTDMIIQSFQHHLLKKVSCRLPFLGICTWGQNLSAWEASKHGKSVGNVVVWSLRHCETQTTKREMGVFDCDIVMGHLDPMNTVESSKIDISKDMFHISLMVFVGSQRAP